MLWGKLSICIRKAEYKQTSKPSRQTSSLNEKRPQSQFPIFATEGTPSSFPSKYGSKRKSNSDEEDHATVYEDKRNKRLFGAQIDFVGCRSTIGLRRAASCSPRA